MSPEQRDGNLLDIIVELIEHLDRRLEDIFKEDFLDSRDEVDLSAFRLASIGEMSHKLSDALKARHPSIDWGRAYRMRNIISHDYEGIDAEIVWVTATTKLDALKEVCVVELKQLDAE